MELTIHVDIGCRCVSVADRARETVIVVNRDGLSCGAEMLYNLSGCPAVGINQSPREHEVREALRCYDLIRLDLCLSYLCYF